MNHNPVTPPSATTGGIATATRVLLDALPFRQPAPELEGNRNPWKDWGRWRAKWLLCPAEKPPFAVAFRRRFVVGEETVVRVHVTGDERYDLWLDGERRGRGPHRGDDTHWFVDSYDLTLPPGEHTLVARVWALGEMAAFAQFTIRPGLLVAAEGAGEELLSTGVAEWETKPLGGYEFTDPSQAWGTGANVVIRGTAYPWGWERGEGDGWTTTTASSETGLDPERANDYPLPAHLLYPAVLPPQLDEPRPVGEVRHVSAPPEGPTTPHPIRAEDDLPDDRADWNALVREGTPLTVPPRTRRRVLWDLGRYHCAYPDLVTTGGAGASVRVHWQEGLFLANHHSNIHKGNRDEIEGKYFTTIWSARDGIGDTFQPDGGTGRHFETLWWQCGRYVEILVETAEEPLAVNRFAVRETRYPLEPESRFESDDARLGPVGELAVRTLQMCAHETYFDCPYYEQLQYVGDTRLQVLVSYALTRDDRLPRHALALFDWSRMTDLEGITQSRYPTRVRQRTWSFPLWWVGMVYDYALWRGDAAFVRERMGGVRAVLDAFSRRIADDGLVHLPTGPNLNFMDWVRDGPRGGWRSGDAVSQTEDVNSVFNWQFVLVLRHAAELEDAYGGPETAARWRRLARETEAAIVRTFWNEARGLFASDRARERYSEHAQCLALLAGGLQPEVAVRVGDGLLTAPDLDRTTIYFSHYLFETFRLLGRADRLFDRLDLWFGLLRDGLTTTIEMPEPTRSDCHAWGAHPLYHFHATLLGVRPSAPGFAAVRVAPNLGPLRRASGTLVHPSGGSIVTAFEVTPDGALRGTVTLPDGIPGVYVAPNGVETSLAPGRNEVG